MPTILLNEDANTLSKHFEINKTGKCVVASKVNGLFSGTV